MLVGFSFVVTEACLICVVAGVGHICDTSYNIWRAPSHHLSRSCHTRGRMLADAGNVNAVTSAKSCRAKNTI